MRIEMDESHAVSLLHGVETCWRSGSMCDTIIVTGAEQVQCHRLVLTSVSPLLANIVKSLPLDTDNVSTEKNYSHH